MPDFSTVTDLLAAQPVRKLERMKAGIQEEMRRLEGEFKLVEQALARKRSSSDITARERPVAKTNGGRFDGLPRKELLNHVALVGHPVGAAEMQEILAKKGIERRVEAIRTGLARLEKSGDLVRTEPGKFAVPSANGDGHATEAPALSRQASLGDGYPSGASDG